jgi:hypothetical protein
MSSRVRANDDRRVNGDQPAHGALVAAFGSLGLVVRPEQETALRDAICDFVISAKLQGMQPEQVIVAIRAAARSNFHEVSPALMQRAIQWCLDKYFDRSSDT